MSKIPQRKDIAESDKWDLSSLYTSGEAWEKDFSEIGIELTEAEKFKGKLADTPETLLEALVWKDKLFIFLEKLASYAFLNYCTEPQNPINQERFGKISQLEAKIGAALSFFDPEIMNIENLKETIERTDFKDYKVYLNKLLALKAHVLPQEQERILALESESAATPSNTFEMLTNVDMKFGEIDGKPLTNSTFSSFMISPDREIRKKAYLQYYEEFKKHQMTIASLYAGSVNHDVFTARVRKFNSAIERALFPDHVDLSVYKNLIETVHSGFPTLHKYYEVKRKALGLDKFAHYDAYVPMVSGIETHTTYDEAVEIIKKALAPLGKEYVDTIYKGLTTEHWVDKYETEGKRSGAFSAGVFTGKPYIMTNFKEDVIRSVLTLAHEGGHSMHSYYSTRNNPYSCYDYTIFEAEVASTFNEQLTNRYLQDNASSKEMRAYLISNQLDDIVATLFRQTMFAEYEMVCHELVEKGTPLTIDILRKEYRKLLTAYFGEDVELEDVSDLEGLRIPHFYRAFYVYKYSTGICASIALSERVLNGGEKELNDYLNFLKSGGSKYPLESLKLAGVDMSSQEPIKQALNKFSELLDEFEKLI